MIYECDFFPINRAVARLHYLAEDAIQVATSLLLNLLNIRMWLPEQFNKWHSWYDCKFFDSLVVTVQNLTVRFCTVLCILNLIFKFPYSSWLPEDFKDILGMAVSYQIRISPSNDPMNTLWERIHQFLYLMCCDQSDIRSLILIQIIPMKYTFYVSICWFILAAWRM